MANVPTHKPENYRISAEDKLGLGGAKTKYADNIAAIKTLKRLESQGAKAASPPASPPASPEDKKILVRYVGWGGLPQAFDPKNKAWSKEYEELRALLPDSEYAAARRSTQDAHYTSERVIRGIYQGLERLGVIKEHSPPLRVLEPSAGIGHFMGLFPEQQQSNFAAIELDPTSAAISRCLYPEANHINQGFQHTTLRDGAFDLAVGNPPFGKQSVFDPDHPALNKFSIHNYFMAKSLAKLREGGIGAFVVSHFFMDAADSTVREHIARYADFLGGIRLPDTAFRENALTDVTTDILFFQKNSGEQRRGKEWINTASIAVEDLKEGGKKSAAINTYFAENSGQIIGKMAFAEHGLFQNALTCVADPSLNPDLGQEIAQRLEALPRQVYEPALEKADKEQANKELDSPDVAGVAGVDEKFLTSDYFQSLKKGAFCVEPATGRIVFKAGDAYGLTTYKPLPLKRASDTPRLTGLIGVRDTLRQLLNAEKSDADTAHIEALRSKLNARYDGFIKKFGYLNSTTNRPLMREDPEHSLLESLERAYDRGLSPEQAKKQGRKARPPSAQKADIFRQRVLHPTKMAARADNPKDALLISLRESGKVNFPRMAELAGLPAKALQEDLERQKLIFLNPATAAWEIRDKYLTGNVREKLRLAREAALDDPRFTQNVEALSAAMPPEVEAADIGIKFGSAWVPAEVFSAFVEEVIGGGHREIAYLPTLGRWKAKVAVYDHTLNTSVWGLPEYTAGKIVEALLENTPIKIKKDSGQVNASGEPITVVDQELTAAAMQKADEIKQAFLDWVWTDDTRRKELSTLYNERFNTHVPPRYDGSLLELVNASDSIKLRQHQKDVIWRGIQEGTALFDHVVGAGKTLAAVATAMESKRMGFMDKPMIVVPNHLLHQWREEFYQLYPDANILVAEKTFPVFLGEVRFFSRIATGDWDAVIVPHSSFKKIEMPRETQQEILEEQISAVLEAIKESKARRGSRSTIKQLEKQREAMQARFDKLTAMGGEKDQAVDFADLGVDALFVDEAHEFKNLGFTTTMNVSGLGNVGGSSKALDLFVKCRHLQRQNQGRGVYFLTGTPISNTIAEVYTQQRYLQYEDLQTKGIEHFDAWASTFGQVTSGWELDATGVNYKHLYIVPLTLIISIISIISKYYIYNQVQRSPVYTPCIRLFCGYLSGYLCILT